MKHLIIPILCLIGFNALSQRRPTEAVGLRLGDPVGITYKRYLPGNHAFEAIFGGSPHGWHHAYYQNAFEDYSQYDQYTYFSHTVETAIYLQARYLLQYNIPVEGMIGKLDWYWGVGGLLKFAKVRYRYLNPDANPTTQANIKIDVDLGPEAILGMEYLFEDVPIAVFGEASFAVEILDRPGAFIGLGAVGIRYNFR
jgi:hypothetical protein